MFAVIASAALLATSAVAQSVGSAVVVNKCEYDVYLANTPAQGGGYNDVDKTLSYGDSYTQQWTELSNGFGWAIKLAKDNSDWTSNILQYEYTFHNDGIIWYDLSAVNGNPWDNNWEVTATSEDGTCKPRQAAYRYATDDAYGMQDCSQDSTVTVTLCSGEEQNDGEAASASSSMAAVTSSQAIASSVASFSAPASAAPSQYSEVSTTAVVSETSIAQSSSATAAVSTTLATRVSSSNILTTNQAGATVTEVATAVVTEVATVTQWWHHPHQRRHGHA